MRNRKLVLTIAIMTVLMLGFQTAFVNAQTLSEIREQIRDKEAALEEGRSQEENLASQVAALEQELAKLDAAIAEGETELKKLEKELAEAQAKVDTQNDNLNSRLRNMYKTSSVGYVDVLLDSGSFSEFLTNLELVKVIYSKDQEVLKGLKKAREVVKKKKEEVETLQAELEESRKVTASNKAVIEEKKKQIAASNSQMKAALDALEQDAYRLIAESQGDIDPNKPYAGGVMAHPAPTCTIVTSPFGWRSSPSGFHTGIDLAKYGSAQGHPIVAANDGVVTRASWFGGYGNCIQIDHGGGIVTLYAHASRLLVRKGQSVSRGQKIGEIGNTGYSFGAHLHFEVQINSNPVNPYSYIY